MQSIKEQIENLPEIGGKTKGVYLPYSDIKRILVDIADRQDKGDHEVSFAKVIREAIDFYYSERDIIETEAV